MALSICTHIDKSVGTEISKEAITLNFCKAVPNPHMKITENVQAIITAEVHEAECWLMMIPERDPASMHWRTHTPQPSKNVSASSGVQPGSFWLLK